MPAFSPVQTDASRSSEIAAVIESASSASGEGLPIANFSFEAQPADYTDQVTGWNKDSDSHLAQKICQTPQKKNAHGQKYLELYHDLGEKPADGSCAIRTAQAVGIYKPGMRYTLKVLLSRSGDAQAERSVVISLSTLSGKVVSQTIALTQIPENEFAEFATILDTSTNRKCIGQEIYATVEFMARKGQWGRAWMWIMSACWPTRLGGGEGVGGGV